MSPVGKSWSARREHSCAVVEGSGTAIFQRNRGLTAAASWPWWQKCKGSSLDFLRTFSILAAHISSKLCPRSCRLGQISLEIVSVGVRSGELGMKERKTVPLGWENARGGGVLRTCRVCHQKNVQLCYHIAFPEYYFILLVGKDKAGSAKPAGLHMLFHVSPAVDQRKRGGSLVSQAR